MEKLAKQDGQAERDSIGYFSLSGESIAPRPFDKRTVSAPTLVIIWFCMALSVTLFMQTAQLYYSMSVGSALWCLFVSMSILCFIMWFTQDIGIKYGIPFSVAIRPSFGYLGSLVPAVFRGAPAIFWFGFQTWIGAEALNSLCIILFNYSNLPLLIILFGAAQILHTTSGIKAISRLSYIAAPMIIVVCIYIIIMLFKTYDVTFTSLMSMHGSGGTFTFMGGVMSFIGAWSTMAISIMDICRECKTTEAESQNWWKSTRKYIAAQWLGLVPVTVVFGGVGVLSVALTGEWNPITVLVSLGQDNTVLLIFSLLFILLANWSTNDSGNLFPGAYLMATLFPRKLNFAKAVVVAGVLGLVIMPWNLAGSVLTVASVIGTLLAPICGVMVCDYYILRKRRLNIYDLYHADGQYKYWRNINPAAVLAMIIGIAISVPVWDYVFFVGMLASGIAYYVLMKYWVIKKYPQSDIQGVENVQCSASVFTEV